MKKHTFAHRSLIKRPADEVFDWHLRLGAIARMLPPWRKVKILSREGGPDEKGSRVTLAFKVGPFWKKWVLEHKGFIAGKEFTDEQVEGPFQSWRHRHIVHPAGKETSHLEDKITYSTLLPLNKLIHRELFRFFHWRHITLGQDLETYARYSREPKRILLSGSTGLLGTPLTAFLRAGGHEVVRLVRSKEKIADDAIYWNPETGELDKNQFENFDAVIHLAGENIGTRWNGKKKERLALSRCRDTWFLSQILTLLCRPPKTVICASAVGFYGSRGAEALTEASGKGSGFLADLCEKWEESLRSIENRGSRVVHTRFGAILSPAGGVLKRLLWPFRMGLGGKLGKGDQFFSWIGIDDAIGAIYHALMREEITGPLNAVAPEAATQADFADLLSRSLGTMDILGVPKWCLRLAMGEMADEVLLASQNAVPEILLETGYVFRNPTLKSALSILHY